MNKFSGKTALPTASSRAMVIGLDREGALVAVPGNTHPPISQHTWCGGNCGIHGVGRRLRSVRRHHSPKPPA